MLFCCLWAVHLFQKVCFPEQNGKRPVLRYKKQGKGGMKNAEVKWKDC